MGERGGERKGERERERERGREREREKERERERERERESKTFSQQAKVVRVCTISATASQNEHLKAKSNLSTLAFLL